MKITEITNTHRHEENGNVFYFDDDGKFHRDNDLPAIEWKNGTKEWYQHGERSRGPGAVEGAPPAVIGANGSKAWYYDGQQYDPLSGELYDNDDTARWYDDNNKLVKTRSHKKVASGNIEYVEHEIGKRPMVHVVTPRGDHTWFNMQGKVHRDDDLPAHTDFTGAKHWYKNGQLHRDNDLPAIEKPNGGKEWYRNGKLHRDGGKPAVVYKNKVEYWVDGKSSKTFDDADWRKHL